MPVTVLRLQEDKRRFGDSKAPWSVLEGKETC